MKRLTILQYSIIGLVLTGCGTPYKGLVDPSVNYSVERKTTKFWGTRRFTGTLENMYTATIHALLDLGYGVQYLDEKGYKIHAVSLYDRQMLSTAVITMEKVASYTNPETGRVFPKVKVYVSLLKGDYGAYPYESETIQGKLKNPKAHHPYPKAYNMILDRIDSQLFDKL